jgi:hypothetical protein
VAIVDGESIGRIVGINVEVGQLQHLANVVANFMVGCQLGIKWNGEEEKWK